jgi:hypothetical protein
MTSQRLLIGIERPQTSTSMIDLSHLIKPYSHSNTDKKEVQQLFKFAYGQKKTPEGVAGVKRF